MYACMRVICVSVYTDAETYVHRYVLSVQKLVLCSPGPRLRLMGKKDSASDSAGQAALLVSARTGAGDAAVPARHGRRRKRSRRNGGSPRLNDPRKKALLRV